MNNSQKCQANDHKSSSIHRAEEGKIISPLSDLGEFELVNTERRSAIYTCFCFDWHLGDAVVVTVILSAFSQTHAWLTAN